MNPEIPDWPSGESDSEYLWGALAGFGVPRSHLEFAKGATTEQKCDAIEKRLYEMGGIEGDIEFVANNDEIQEVAYRLRRKGITVNVSIGGESSLICVAKRNTQ